MGIEAVDIVRYPNTIESRPGSASAVVLEVAYRQQTRILHRGRVGIRRSDLLGWRGDGALFGAARRLGIDSSLRRPAQAPTYRTLFETQMRGRYQLSRTMALPTHDETSEASRAAKLYFDFISKSEKELMWSAASMTTRSGNPLRTSGESRVPPPLRRSNLAELRFE